VKKGTFHKMTALTPCHMRSTISAGLTTFQSGRAESHLGIRNSAKQLSPQHVLVCPGTAFECQRSLSRQARSLSLALPGSKTRVTESAETEQGCGSGKAHSSDRSRALPLLPHSRLSPCTQLKTSSNISLIAQRSASTSPLRSTVDGAARAGDKT